MNLLFLDASFREGSRTTQLADYYLEKMLAAEPNAEVTKVSLGDAAPAPLDRQRLAVYNQAVADHDFRDPMFQPAKQVAAADQIIIACPFWNYSIPAVLHDYLEMACSQGVTFDIDETGTYHTLCRARKLTMIMTGGGPFPEPDYSYGYVKALAEKFWAVPEVRCYRAGDMDVVGIDQSKLLGEVKKEMDLEFD